MRLITHRVACLGIDLLISSRRPGAGYRCCACDMHPYRPAAIRFLHYGRVSLDPLLTACLDCRLIRSLLHEIIFCCSIELWCERPDRTAAATCCWEHWT